LRRITQDEYDKKARSFNQRRLEIDILRKQHTNADMDFALTVTNLLNLASRASELFESSKVDQKRQLISFVVSNLRLNGKKVLYDLKKPFEALVACSESSEWLHRLEAIGRCFANGEAGYFPYHVVNGHIDGITVKAA
jgi:hypothetical protein